MTEISGKFTQIQIKDKGDGITQALLKHVQKEKLEMSDGNISKAQWQETIKTLDKIQANRKANNQTSIFGKNYVVNQGDNIDFTEEEMNMLYKSMGVKFSTKPEQKVDKPVVDEAVANKPEEQSEQVINDSAQEQSEVKSYMKPLLHKILQHSMQHLIQNFVRIKIQRAEFETASQNSKLDTSLPNADSLKENGFEFKSLDKNGGKTYTDKDGNSIRISTFEAQFITPGGTQVSFSNGKMTDKIIYNSDGKPVQGTMTVKQDNGTTITYEYKYDENGKKVLQKYNTEYSVTDHSSNQQQIVVQGKPTYYVSEE